VEIGPEAGFGGVAPTLVFVPVPDPTPGKADPEGNEFCLLRRRL